MATRPVKESANEWLAVLAAASKGVPDVVPPGYKTVAQICSETRRSPSSVRLHLRMAVRMGAVEVAKFNIDTGTKLYPTMHYRGTK